jgi:putative heme-binding domain-containing protein
VPVVAALLDDPDVYVRSRGLFLLYQLGAEGRARAGSPESFADASMRIAAYRAMRRADLDVTPIAARLARDTDAGVRREVALSMRDQRAAVALPILADVARRFDGTDRSYLEALGTGATRKEAALYELLRSEMASGDPRAWSAAFSWIAWRLHPPAAIDALARRATATTLPLESRRRAMDALAFIGTRAASTEMVELAAADGPLKEPATWWVLNRMSNDWADHDLPPLLKRRGIFDPETVTLHSAVMPPRDAALPVVAVADVMARTGDATRGKDAFVRCTMCHALGGVGAEVGPALDGWTRGKTAPVIATAIVDPDAGIAHGYAGTAIRTMDGLTIEGLLIKEGDPLMIRSMGNVTQVVPAARVKARERLPRSLMLSAAQLGMTAQDVADVIAFLKAH